TDGSKGNNYVHAAFYDSKARFSQSFVLNEYCSIFTAEAYAVYQALLRITVVNSCTNFLIITDSLSLLESLSNISVNYKTNYVLYIIKELLYKYHHKNVNIAFMWVPSHRGITGNEKADKAAREAINSIDVTNSLLVPF
ncbi:hypothetical protein F3H11_34720, partial [Pseudomonas aeruginosa]